jgi:hypothetical protein
VNVRGQQASSNANAASVDLQTVYHTHALGHGNPKTCIRRSILAECVPNIATERAKTDRVYSGNMCHPQVTVRMANCNSKPYPHSFLELRGPHSYSLAI